jgi:hypothetical protein
VISEQLLAELQDALGLQDEEEAGRIWECIEKTAPIMRRWGKARQTVPDAQKAKIRLQRIQATCQKLANLLRDEPLAPLLFTAGKYPGGLSPDGEVILPTEGETAEFKDLPERFSRQLRVIAVNARVYETDGETFRLAHTLPDPSLSIAAQVLWPILFHIWRSYGKPLTFATEGPLYRFVALAHRGLGLPEPRASTLRDALKRTGT